MNVFDFIDSAGCTGCGACVQSCPHGCMKLQPNKEGFLCPQIDARQCRQCGVCVRKCPLCGERQNNQPMAAWAAYARDEGILRASSSGGVFSVLAKHILGQSGVVVGAAFSDDFECVQHICVEDGQALARLRGSKYLQSDLGDSFRAVKQYLKEGRAVLFSGTPCQVAGLKSYLGGDDPKLLTLDVICRGVPSPKVWSAYLRDLQRQARSPLSGFQFRDKTYGWKNYGMHISFQNKEERWEPQLRNPYYRCFLRSFSLRKSCYNCPFKGGNYASDFSLGDFWGFRHIVPEMDGDRGISLVLTRTGKAARIFKEVQAGLVSYEVDPERASQQSKTVLSSAQMPEKRAEFFDRLDKEPFHRISHSLYPRTVRQWVSDSLPHGLKRQLRRLRGSWRRK